MESKESILKQIEECFIREAENKGRNSMGVSESYYDPYYLIGTCFRIQESPELSSMSEQELNNLLLLANHASEVFY